MTQKKARWPRAIFIPICAIVVSGTAQAAGRVQPTGWLHWVVMVSGGLIALAWVAGVTCLVQFTLWRRRRDRGA